MKYIIFLFLVCGTLSLSGQVTSRLTIQSGSNINFNFQLLDHYNNGVSYNNWTHLTVFFEDLGNPLREWKLSVEATTPVIQGDAGNSLPLNTIEFSITGDDAAATYFNDVSHAVLSPVPTNLVEDGQQTTVPGVLTNLFISYHCGKSVYVANNSLIGKTPDYYYAEILYTLEPE